jgi:hypothetical protein
MQGDDDRFNLIWSCRSADLIPRDRRLAFLGGPELALVMRLSAVVSRANHSNRREMTTCRQFWIMTCPLARCRIFDGFTTAGGATKKRQPKERQHSAAVRRDAGRLPSRDRSRRHPQEGQHRAGAERGGTRDRVPPARDPLCARGIEATGRDAARLGSREPGAAVAARAQAEKQRRLSAGNPDLVASFCRRIIDSDPEHWETLLRFYSTCPGAVPGQIRRSVGYPVQARNLMRAVCGHVLDSKP